MGFAEILIIAIALAMDAFSVSVSAGMVLEHPGPRQYFRLSFHFGLFQFLMPLLGYAAGSTFGLVVREIDHWVAFGLLLLVGLKMIKESLDTGKSEKQPTKDPSRGFNLIILSLATSIDAFAVGFSFHILGLSILFPSLVIGVACLVLSMIGIYLGKKTGRFLGKKAEFAGGMILILIGIKILIDHLRI